MISLAVSTERRHTSYMYMHLRNTELEWDDLQIGTLPTKPPRQLREQIQAMKGNTCIYKSGFHTGFFLGGGGGGEDCMGVVGVGRVKHVLPRGVWGHAPPGIF